MGFKQKAKHINWMEILLSSCHDFVYVLFWLKLTPIYIQATLRYYVKSNFKPAKIRYFLRPSGFFKQTTEAKYTKSQPIRNHKPKLVQTKIYPQ